MIYQLINFKLANLLFSSVFAQEVAAKASPSTLEMLILPIGMFLILIFLVILPTQRRAKQQNMLVSSLKPGDEVITSSGIIAKVRSVADKFVSLEISQNAVIKVLKSHIQTTTKELEKTDEPKKK